MSFHLPLFGQMRRDGDSPFWGSFWAALLHGSEPASGRLKGQWVRARLCRRGDRVAGLRSGRLGRRALSRFMAAAILEYLERVPDFGRSAPVQAAEGLALWSGSPRHGTTSEPVGRSSPAPGSIVRGQWRRSCGRRPAADWVEAETRLSELRDRLSRRPRAVSFEGRTGQSPRDMVRERLAKLEAARAVNDADRVLEIYRIWRHRSTTSDGRRSTSDLAKWFLSSDPSPAAYRQSSGRRGAARRAVRRELRRPRSKGPACAPHCRRSGEAWASVRVVLSRI